MSSIIKTETVQPAGLTDTAQTLDINFSNAFNMYLGESVLMTQKFEKKGYKKFLKLKDQWLEETMFASNSSDIFSNSAYEQIISMGELAIPWIIRDLKRSNNHWFYALRNITGENPIPQEHAGAIDQMKEDWVDWAEINDYL
ncbi:hypothetical protein GTQ34_07280 [Muricauda sp. JGD-17]|uniref:Uncharacterized protein n=1 Tax=Flagellimonas ochracea TaxID=2696472 RepID=A0A964TCX5_9FLAO|nr:hypothetical protein [Allomuricauda ochracea]NAY91713.1 hypothetical protein [Allomuricauda ochracea]